MTVVLGFDFGMKHIGVAVGQTITHTATPLLTLKAVDGIPTWSEIQALIQEWRPSRLVVGIPLNMDGSEQPLTLRAKAFARRLKAHSKLPIEHIDERLSSWEAKQRWFQSQTKKRSRQQETENINAMAAAILIEQWFSANAG